jgi:hypothetical protein
VGDVGIVAGVFDHAGGRAPLAEFVMASAKAGRPPPRGKLTSTGSGKSPVSNAA